MRTAGLIWEFGLSASRDVFHKTHHSAPQIQKHTTQGIWVQACTRDVAQLESTENGASGEMLGAAGDWAPRSWRRWRVRLIWQRKAIVWTHNSHIGELTIARMKGAVRTPTRLAAMSPGGSAEGASSPLRELRAWRITSRGREALEMIETLP